MQCKELEAVLAYEGLSPLPPEAREHLSGCTSCQDLLADLSTIVVAAKRLPAEVAPPDRIWISLRAQLEAEGIIREVPGVAVPLPSPWWQSFAAFFQPRALATAAAALFLVAGSVYVIEHRNTRTAPPPQVQTPPSTQAQTGQNPLPAPSNSKPVSEGSTLSAANTSSSKASSAHHNAPSRPAIASPDSGLRPSPSENAYLGDSRALLADVQDSLPRNALADNPAVDASLRQNLRTINEFIAECETRLKQNPQDQLTREYLNMAYQQKAELLNAMMDSGRSEH
jgi:hypothetical protein